MKSYGFCFWNSQSCYRCVCSMRLFPLYSLSVSLCLENKIQNSMCGYGFSYTKAKIYRNNMCLHNGWAKAQELFQRVDLTSTTCNNNTSLYVEHLNNIIPKPNVIHILITFAFEVLPCLNTEFWWWRIPILCACHYSSAHAFSSATQSDPAPGTMWRLLLFVCLFVRLWVCVWCLLYMNLQHWFHVIMSIKWIMYYTKIKTAPEHMHTHTAKTY